MEFVAVSTQVALGDCLVEVSQGQVDEPVGGSSRYAEEGPVSFSYLLQMLVLLLRWNKVVQRGDESDQGHYQGLEQTDVEAEMVFLENWKQAGLEIHDFGEDTGHVVRHVEVLGQ